MDFRETAFYKNIDNWEDDVLYAGSYLVEAKNTVNGNYLIKDGTKCIGDSAFSNCSKLVSVVIPDGALSIGDSAFSDCTNLISITIPDSVTNIGSSAFSECRNLIFIKIPDKIKIIEDYTFYNCTSLEGIDLSNGLETIGKTVFCGCHKLTSLVLPEGLKIIEETTFNNCGIVSVVVPSSLSNVGYGAFSTFGSLKYVFYNGTLEEWNDIVVSSWNEDLLNSAIHFNSLEHSESDWIVVKEPSCEQSGYSIIEWFVCHLELERKVFHATGHIYENDFTTDKAASCLTEGVKSKHCINCDKKIDLTTIPATGHSISDWIIDKEATVYSTGSKHKVCTECTETLKTETIPQLKCSKAKLSKISNTTSGVKITWGKVEGADTYRVYRKTSKTDWDYIGSTSKTNYTDKTAKSGTSYYYAVKVRNEAGDSGLSTSLSIKRLSVPKISTVANTSSGVKVSWKKVTGASGYIVYRKTKNGDWKEIGKTSKLYYTDKKAKSGTSYCYSVRAYSGSVKSYYDTDGLGIRRLVAPKISSATSKSEGILIKWNKITGATGYYVYRKASSGEWKKIDTVKGNTKVKYLDESPRKGATYQYRVKAYYSKSTSYNSNTYKIKCKY